MNRDYGKITEETLLIRSRKPVPDRFAGKAAIVTGGSTGIGEAIVEELCREGASVAFTGRTVSTGKTTERRLLDAGFDVIFVAGDMIKEEFCREVVDKTVGKWGKVTVHDL